MALRKDRQPALDHPLFLEWVFYFTRMREPLLSFPAIGQESGNKKKKEKRLIIHFCLFYLLDPVSRHGMTIRRLVSLFTIASILLVPLSPASYAADDPVNRAVAYLKSKPANPWTTMALVAAGEPNVSTDHLKTVDVSEAVKIEAPILAIAAIGHDPRTFAQENLVTKLKSFHREGQIGDPGLLNDDIFGILALRAAGEPSTDSAVQDAKTTILNKQETNGSWGDTNITAVAVQALIEAGLSPTDEKITKALAWFKGTQNDDGGFPYSWPVNSYTGQPDPSDSSSSAWVAHAIRKTDQDPTSASWEKNGKDAVDSLLALQQQNGSFAHSSFFTDETSFSPISTAYAVIALTGKNLPVAKFTPSGNNDGNSGNNSSNEYVSFRIEGSQAVVCAGTLPLSQVPHALEVVPKAAAQCGFTYEIVQSSFGPYLKTIGSDTTQGLMGWLYRVDWKLPDIGAADYALQAGDEVLWYYGDFAWSPLHITTTSTKVGSGEPFNITIKQYSPAGETSSPNGAGNGAWQPIEATILGGSGPFQSNAQGMATVTLADGIWTLWGEAAGHVRSNRTSITVGSGNGQSVGLAVNVTSLAGGGGGQGGGTLSFVVEPSAMAFGNIPAGSAGERTLTLKNNGTVNASFTSTVHGDGLFIDNLKLDNASWRSFNASLTASGSRNVHASLAVPSNSTAGVKQGILVFWAQAQ